MRRFVGNAAMSDLSMFRSFCGITIAACDGVAAGAMISATLGGYSGITFGGDYDEVEWPQAFFVYIGHGIADRGRASF